MSGRGGKTEKREGRIILFFSIFSSSGGFAQRRGAVRERESERARAREEDSEKERETERERECARETAEDVGEKLSKEKRVKTVFQEEQPKLQSCPSECADREGLSAAQRSKCHTPKQITSHTAQDTMELPLLNPQDTQIL